MNLNSSYNKARYDLALTLKDIGAVTFAPNHPLGINFRTQSHPRPGPLTKWAVDFAARCMRGLQLERKLAFDAVAGVPWTGNPFAAELARLAGVPYILVEKQERGGKWYIALKELIPEGVKKVLLVDDTVDGANSKLETIGVLHNKSVEVKDVMVLVENQRGGRQELSKLRYRLHSVFTMTEFLEVYVMAGTMEPKLRDEIHTHLASKG